MRTRKLPSLTEIMSAKLQPKLELPKKKQEEELDEVVTVWCKTRAGRIFQVYLAVCQISCPKSRREKCKEYWDVMKEKFGIERPAKRKYTKRKRKEK